MATIDTHTETIHQRQLVLSKSEVLRLLLDAGKLPREAFESGSTTPELALDNGECFTVAWTARESHNAQEDV